MIGVVVVSVAVAVTAVDTAAALPATEIAVAEGEVLVPEALATPR